MLLKSLVHATSPAGPRGRLSVMIFHRVLDRPDPLFPDEADTARFAQILGWVQQWYRVLPLDEAVARLREGRLPARALAISFDDGYADNATNAAPILKRHGMTATFFVATSFLDGGRMWNDTIIESIRRAKGDHLDLQPLGLGLLPIRSLDERRAAVMAALRAIKYLPGATRLDAVQRLSALCRPGALPDDLMMRSEQVLGLLRDGMQVGAHTLTHPILSKTEDAEARREIRDSKQVLEGILGRPVTLFAYPNGKPHVDYEARHAAMVREAGFDAAFSTAAGSAGAGADLYQLPRFTPWDRQPARFGLRLLRNGVADGERCA